MGKKTDAFIKLDTLGNPSEQELLEQILCILSPKCGSAALSAALLERFDTLVSVLEAPAALLAEVPGMTVPLANALSAYPDVFRLYLELKKTPRKRILDTACAYDAVISKFFGRKTEIMVLLILDSKGYMKYMGVIHEGSVDSVPFCVREIVRDCLLYDADTVYVAHNHPSGNCTPSRQDILATKEIEMALSAVQITLSDHFIFSDEDFYSFRSSGILNRLRNELFALRQRMIQS